MKKIEVSFIYSVLYQQGGTSESKTATEIVDATNESTAFILARNLVEQREIRVFRAVCVTLPCITTAIIKQTSQAAINAELKRIFSELD